MISIKKIFDFFSIRRVLRKLPTYDNLQFVLGTYHTYCYTVLVLSIN